MTGLDHPQDLSDDELRDVLLDMELSVRGRSVGTVTIRFWPDAAPRTVRNFLRYVSEGFYDGKCFHRVIPDFMIQGGCPDGTGKGHGPHGTIPGEFSSDRAHSHRRGVISMARSQDRNSASCQFFICHGHSFSLDGEYAAFGRMVDGFKALDRVASVRTGGGGEGSTPQSECLIVNTQLRMSGEAPSKQADS